MKSWITRGAPVTQIFSTDSRICARLVRSRLSLGICLSRASSGLEKSAIPIPSSLSGAFIRAGCTKLCVTGRYWHVLRRPLPRGNSPETVPARKSLPSCPAGTRNRLHKFHLNPALRQLDGAVRFRQEDVFSYLDRCRVNGNGARKPRTRVTSRHFAQKLVLGGTRGLGTSWHRPSTTLWCPDDRAESQA